MRVPPPDGVEVYLIRYRAPGADPQAVPTAEVWPARARFSSRLRLDKVQLMAQAPEADEVALTERWLGAHVQGRLGALTGIEAPDGTPVRDGLMLWALRDKLAPDLVEELVHEVLRRLVAERAAATAEEAQEIPFATPSGSPSSPERNGGTAGSAVAVASTS